MGGLFVLLFTKVLRKAQLQLSQWRQCCGLLRDRKTFQLEAVGRTLTKVVMGLLRYLAVRLR